MHRNVAREDRIVNKLESKVLMRSAVIVILDQKDKSLNTKSTHGVRPFYNTPCISMVKLAPCSPLRTLRFPFICSMMTLDIYKPMPVVSDGDFGDDSDGVVPGVVLAF